MNKIDFSAAKKARNNFVEWAEVEGKKKELANNLNSLIEEKNKLADLRNEILINGTKGAEYSKLLKKSIEHDLLIDDTRRLIQQNQKTEIERSIEGKELYKISLKERRKTIESEIKKANEVFRNELLKITDQLRQETDYLFALFSLVPHLRDESDTTGRRGFELESDYIKIQDRDPANRFDWFGSFNNPAFEPSTTTKRELIEMILLSVEESLLSKRDSLDSHFESDFLLFIKNENGADNLNLGIVGSGAALARARGIRQKTMI